MQHAEWLPGPAGRASRTGRIAILRRHLCGKGAEAIAAAAAVEYGQADLPGPTGEANTLSLLPRGRVLCLGPDADALLAQAIQALAAGNAVLAVAPGAPSALQALTGKGLPLAAIDATVAPRSLEDLAVDVVACAAPAETLRPLRQALAARKGPIVPLVIETLYPAAYAHERAICVDTTAAGGNASLPAGA